MARGEEVVEGAPGVAFAAPAGLSVLQQQVHLLLLGTKLTLARGEGVEVLGAAALCPLLLLLLVLLVVVVVVLVPQLLLVVV
jgi:hypothetical protein